MTHPCAVLVVEDNRPIRDLLAESCRDAGFEVQTAANGREAFAVLQRWHPDVITLDLEMPIMDGWAFRSTQRRVPDLRAIPVIVVSADANLEAQAAALDAAAVVRKPCDLDLLAQVISRVVGPTHEASAAADRPEQAIVAETAQGWRGGGYGGNQRA
jgi:CheY-like chemotaxis protein